MHLLVAHVVGHVRVITFGNVVYLERQIVDTCLGERDGEVNRNFLALSRHKAGVDYGTRKRCVSIHE